MFLTLFNQGVATDLKETFAFPAPPAKPQVEKANVSAVADTEAMKEAEWPPLYNPVDDPANFNDEFEWEKDDGLAYPKRLYPVGAFSLLLFLL